MTDEPENQPDNLVLRELRALRIQMNERFDSMQQQLDGQFGLLTSKTAGVEALERLVAAQGKRITALERKP